MNKFEQKLSGWNFKRIAKRGLLILLAAAVVCAAAVGFVYRGRIAFAWRYTRVREAAEKGDAAALRAGLDSLAASPDVTDALWLDDGNNVLYAAKNSAFAQSPFQLVPAGDAQGYYVSSGHADAVFKYVRSDDYLLRSVFRTEIGDVRESYEEESFYESGFGSRTVYTLAFLRVGDAGEKIYILSVPAAVAGGAAVLKAAAAAAVLFFMSYWVLLALWAYQNAAKAKLYALPWGLAVLLTNLAGVLVYALYKRAGAVCPACGAVQSRQHRFCAACGARLGAACPACGAQVGGRDRYCPACGAELRR